MSAEGIFLGGLRQGLVHEVRGGQADLFEAAFEEVDSLCSELNAPGLFAFFGLDLLNAKQALLGKVVGVDVEFVEMGVEARPFKCREDFCLVQPLRVGGLRDPEKLCSQNFLWAVSAILLSRSSGTGPPLGPAF